MELRISGPNRSRTCTWKSYALIRDNVQHMVEQGAPSERFAALHEIESAVDGETCMLPAVRLMEEVRAARHALRGLRLAQAAVSLRTRAIMTRCPEPPAVRGTVPARQMGWELPVEEPETMEVCDAARSFLDAISEVIEDAAGDELVAIMLEGGRPRHASSPDA